MFDHWLTKRLWYRPKYGSVVFLIKGEHNFRHAAIYIGRGLYISVWGAGGDLEIASLKSMKKDFEANRVEIATPR
jgi:cell wall-associated NlpC family hydrolase